MEKSFYLVNGKRKSRQTQLWDHKVHYKYRVPSGQEIVRKNLGQEKVRKFYIWSGNFKNLKKSGKFIIIPRKFENC